MNKVVVSVESECYTPEALKQYVEAQLDDLHANPGIEACTCSIASTRPRDEVVGKLIWHLEVLEYVANQMLSLYLDNQWLNDAVNLVDIVPLSLDEWHVEIHNKIGELRSGHLQ